MTWNRGAQWPPHIGRQVGSLDRRVYELERNRRRSNASSSSASAGDSTAIGASGPTWRMGSRLFTLSLGKWRSLWGDVTIVQFVASVRVLGSGTSTITVYRGTGTATGTVVATINIPSTSETATLTVSIPVVGLTEWIEPRVTTAGGHSGLTLQAKLG